MFCYTGIKNACANTIGAKKTVLYSFLLIFLSFQSTCLQAEVAEVSPLESEAVAGLKAGAGSADGGPVDNVPASGYRRGSSASPQYKQKLMVPPPPPGPYKSSALRESSARTHAFNHAYKQPSGRPPLNRPPLNRQALNKQALNRQALNRQTLNRPPLNKGQLQHPYHQNVPMTTFSPDRPWPENLRPGGYKSSDKWVPGNTNHYVQPTARQKPYPQKPYPVSPKKRPPDVYHQLGQSGSGNNARRYENKQNRGHSNIHNNVHNNVHNNGYSNGPNYGAYLGQRPPPAPYYYDGR